MATNKLLKRFLDENHIEWDECRHPKAFTAAETAQAQHIPGDMMLKPVIVKDKDDNHFWMCVLSAARRIDFKKLKHLLGEHRNLVLASEEEVLDRFPDFEKGAEPPFGLFGEMDVLLDEAIEEQEYVVFNGGTHTDAIQLRREDYERLAKPEVFPFATPA